jgi:hypothetical protein
MSPRARLAAPPPAKIRWAPRLRPQLLARLYAADASGLPDEALCEEVGSILLARCETFARVQRGEVVCPACRSGFVVARSGETSCPGESCGWRTDFGIYRESIRRHYAATGRARAAYDEFLRGYPSARSYSAQMLLIDRLIHSFHVDEKTGAPVKSAASKLLEGNKKDVVRFLDALSARDGDAKAAWRETTARTIDARGLARPGS